MLSHFARVTARQHITFQDIQDVFAYTTQDFPIAVRNNAITQFWFSVLSTLTCNATGRGLVGHQLATTWVKVIRLCFV